MKCDACDCILSDAEDGQKFAESGARVGLCTKCVTWIPPDLAIVGGVPLSSQTDDIDDSEIPLDADKAFIRLDEDDDYFR